MIIIDRVGVAKQRFVIQRRRVKNASFLSLGVSDFETEKSSTWPKREKV